MNTDQAIKIAIECIQSRMKKVHYKARRYELDPVNWKEYKAGYTRYKKMVKAIAALEAIQAQGRLW